VCGVAEADTSSIAFIDHETVGHVNLLDCTIETRKILLSGDGQIYLELFKFLDVPVVRALIINWWTQWGAERRSPFHHHLFSGSTARQPQAPILSSSIPEQPRTIVALSLFYVTNYPSPMQPDMHPLGQSSPERS